MSADQARAKKRPSRRRAASEKPAPAEQVAAPAAAPAAPLRAYFESEPEPAPVVVSPMVSKNGEEPTKAQQETYQRIPDKLFEERALICVALRFDGRTYKEIEAMTGMSQAQVRYACKRARTAGRLNDVIDLIDNEMVPQAVENLREALNDPTSAQHWLATSETLHGRGILRKFNNNRTDGGGGAALPPLQINFINPGGGNELPNVIINSEKGSAIGTPRLLDA